MKEWSDEWLIKMAKEKGLKVGYAKIKGPEKSIKGCPSGFMRKNNLCYKKVKSVRSLINLCKKGYNEYVLFLRGGLKSSKIIHYTPEVWEKPFDVWHLVDDSEERLSAGELKKSNIGSAIKGGAFWCETTFGGE